MNKIKKTAKPLILVTLIALSFTSCKKEDNTEPSQTNNITENSYFISGNGLSNEFIAADGDDDNEALYRKLEDKTTVEAISNPGHQGFAFHFKGDKKGDFDNTNGLTFWIGIEQYDIWSDESKPHTMTLHVDEYNSVGNVVKGAFSGSFTANNGKVYTISDGKINLKRASDI